MALIPGTPVHIFWYWIFSDLKPEACSEGDDEDCCSGYVYVFSAILNILQYVLYALYVLITVFVPEEFIKL